MNEINVEKQKLVIRILKIIWYVFIPIMFAIIMYMHDRPRSSDYIFVLMVVLITNTIGNCFLSLYQKFLQEQS
jgi:hypothetical protein